MSALSEIGHFLESQGLGTQGSTLFLGSRPDAPDTVLAVYQYPSGSSPEYVQESFGPIAEKVQIQVVARSRDYAEAEQLAYQAWSALAAVTNAILSGTKYRKIIPNSSPGLLGRDTDDRLLVSFNATVDKEVSLVA